MERCKIFIYALILVIPQASGKFYYCPQVNIAEGPLRFTRELGSLDYGCSGSSKRIFCCASGFDALYWYKLEGEEWTKYPPPEHTGSCDVGCRFELLRSNTTLAIKPPREDDSGSYRCVVINDKGLQLQHEIELKVVECGNWNKPPYKLQPLNKTLTNGVLIHKRKHGQHVSFICEGFFGDPIMSFNEIRWQRKNKTSGQIRSVEAWGPRFNVTVRDREEKNILLANLTITDIEEGDYDDYICRMSNGFKDGTMVIARLEYGEENPVTPQLPVWIYIVSTIAGVVLVVIVVLVVSQVCGLEVKLLYRTVKNRIHKEKAADADRQFDAYIYTCPDSVVEKDFADKEIKCKLEAQGFKVKMDQEVQGNQSEIRDFGHALEQCRRFIIVISPDLLNPTPDYFDYFLAEALAQHTRIIFIIFGEIRPEDWKTFEETQKAKCRDTELLPKVMKAQTVLKRLQYYPEADAEEKMTHRWRFICHRTKRQKNERFWKELQLLLPSPSKDTDEVDGRRNYLDSSSTDTPLLAEGLANPVVEPTAIVITPDDKGDDEVFEYAADQNAYAASTDAGLLGNQQAQGHRIQNQVSEESAYFSGSGSYQAAATADSPQKSESQQPFDGKICGSNHRPDPPTQLIA